MPRKSTYDRPSVRLSEYKIPKIDPKDRNAADDYALVRHVLVDFDELALLSDETRKQLVEDLVIAIWAWRAGVKAGKRGLSNEKEAQHIFISNVGHALGRAGSRVRRWRKTYEGDGPARDAPESFFFRLVRALGKVFHMAVPKDLKLAGQKASWIKYEMSPAMKAAQDVELAAQARRSASVWGVCLVSVPRSCGELASTYLGFPF